MRVCIDTNVLGQLFEAMTRCYLPDAAMWKGMEHKRQACLAGCGAS